MGTPTKIRCGACYTRPATQENYMRFNGFWCDDCVEKATKELKRRAIECSTK